MPVLSKAIRTPTGGIDREDMHTLIPAVSGALSVRDAKGQNSGCDQGPPLIPIAHALCQRVGCLNSASGHAVPGNSVQDADQGYLIPVAHALRADGFDASEDGIGVEAVAFANTSGNTALGMSKPGVPPLTTRNGDPGSVLLPSMQVRRLTPVECERLQGFPDNYTAITRKGKPAADGPRYKALGNSMAVPVMRWIGQRIAMVEELR